MSLTYFKNNTFYEYCLINYLSYLSEYEYDKIRSTYFKSSIESELVKYIDKNVTSNIIFSNPNYHHDTDAQMIMLKTVDNQLIFSFRGTESLIDVAIDFTICKTPFSCLESIDQFTDLKMNIPNVHFGFYSQFKELEQDITKFINKHTVDNKINKLIFIGHSLGGSVSTLAAAAFALKYLGKIPVMCMTTGSPLVGDVGFCKLYNHIISESYNLVYRYDPAPHMPSICCFKRQGGVIHINNDLTIDNLVDWNVLEGMVSCCCVFPLVFGCTKKYDHNIERYMKIIKQIK
jgi:predicted lipase